MTPLLPLVHFASTWYLVGLCWLVQRVQYPLMGQVGIDQFVAYERAHVSRMGLVVAPMMLIELATGLLLLATGSELYRRPVFLTAMGLLAAIWASTFLIQVPIHRVLETGFDSASHAMLVKTNWIRTLAWTARGILLCWVLRDVLRTPSA